MTTRQPIFVPVRTKADRAMFSVVKRTRQEEAEEILARPGAVSSTGMLNPRVVSPDEARIVAQARAEAELAAGPKPQFKVRTPIETTLETLQRAPLGAVSYPFSPSVRETYRGARETGETPLGAIVTAEREGLARTPSVRFPVTPKFTIPLGTRPTVQPHVQLGLKGAAELALDPTNLLPGIGFGGAIAKGGGAVLKTGAKKTAEQLVKVPQRQVQEAGLRLAGAGGGVAGGAPIPLRPSDVPARITKFLKPDVQAQWDEVVKQADLLNIKTEAVAGILPDEYFLAAQSTKETPKKIRQAFFQSNLPVIPGGAALPSHRTLFFADFEALGQFLKTGDYKPPSLRFGGRPIENIKPEYVAKQFAPESKPLGARAELRRSVRRPQMGESLRPAQVSEERRVAALEKLGQQRGIEITIHPEPVPPKPVVPVAAGIPATEKAALTRLLKKAEEELAEVERGVASGRWAEEASVSARAKVAQFREAQRRAREGMSSEEVGDAFRSKPVPEAVASPPTKPTAPVAVIRQALQKAADNVGAKIEVFDIQSAERKQGFHFKIVMPDGAEYLARNNADGIDFLTKPVPVTTQRQQVARGEMTPIRQEGAVGVPSRQAEAALGAESIFIRALKKTEQGSPSATRHMAQIPDKPGWDKVYKPYGEEGRGYYYIRKPPQAEVPGGVVRQPTMEEARRLDPDVDELLTAWYGRIPQKRSLGDLRATGEPGQYILTGTGEQGTAKELATLLRSKAEVPVPPTGFRFGGADRPGERVYAVHLLSGKTLAPEAVEKVVRLNEVDKYGLEWRGEFLMPKDAPDRVEYAIRRDFLVGPADRSEQANAFLSQAEAAGAGKATDALPDTGMVSSMERPPAAQAAGEAAPAPGRTPRVRRAPPPESVAETIAREVVSDQGRSLRLSRAAEALGDATPEELLRTARQAIRSGDEDVLGLLRAEFDNRGLRRPRMLDAGKEPPPQQGAPGAAPSEAAGVVPPAPAAASGVQEARAQLEATLKEVEEALGPSRRLPLAERQAGGARATPLEPVQAPSRQPSVEAGAGPPGGRLPSGRAVGGPGRAQPPPPRDPYGMLKASLEPERDPLIQRVQVALPQELYDRNFPLKELEAATGIPARKAAQVVPGAMAAGEDVVRRFYAPIVKTVEKDLKFLERYMVLMRDSDILARNPHARLPGGIANEGERQIALAALKRDVGAERFAQIEQAAAELWRANDEQVLRPWLDEGIISRDMDREMTSAHPHYIPFMRDDFAEVIYNSFSARPEANLSTTGIRKMGLEGSERTLSNPLLRLLQQPIKAKQTIFRNRAAKSIVRALEELQRQTGEELVRYIDPKKEMNIVQRVTGENIPRLKKGESSQVWETISFFENGVKNRVEVPSIYGRVAKGLEAEPDNILLWIARKVNAPLRLGATTFNPFFTPTNVIRDAMSAMFREKVFPFGPDYMAGLWGAIRKNADFSEASQAGALLGGLIDDMSRARILKNPLGGITVKNPWEAITLIPRLIEEMNIIAERGVRIATFRKLRAEGLDQLEAAVRSRDATVDFAKSGHSMRVINQVIPFTNAATQGTANIVRTIRDHPARSAAFAAMFAGVAITVRVNNMRFETSELIPDYEYTRNWVVQFGEGTRADGTKYPIYLKIPKGEIAAIFTFVPEAMFHLARKSEDRSATELLLSSGFEVTRAVSPIEIGGATGLIPPILETGVGLQTGVNPFTGAPLIPERLRGLPPEQQFTRETSQTAIQIGKLFKVSPMLVDFALNDVAAGGGQTLNWLSSMGVEALGVDLEAFGSGDPDADLAPTGLEKLTKERTPGISRFVGTRDTQLERRGYDNLVDAVVDTNRALSNFPDVSRLGIKFGQVGGTIDKTELTPQQRARYQELAGQSAIEELTRVQSLPDYEEATDAAKEAIIRAVFDEAREKARALMQRDVLSPQRTRQQIPVQRERVKEKEREQIPVGAR